MHGTEVDVNVDLFKTIVFPRLLDDGAFLSHDFPREHR